MSPRNLLREELRSFKPYVAGKPIEEVKRELGLSGRIAKLASNENPLGTSPKAIEAMKSVIENNWLYPDDNSYYLRQKLAKRFNVELNNVIALAGSVEAIEQMGIAFLKPGDGFVTSEKTFAIYALVAQKFGANLKLSPMTDGGYRYDLEAMAKLITPDTKMVILANPTNPTGTWFTGTEFDEFMNKVPEDTLVIYDNAYHEYVTLDDLPDPFKHFHAGRRIAILRTFSKAYGLAGVRCGYGIAPADIIAGMMTCRFPFNVNLVAQAGALAALDDDEFVARSRDFNTKELAFLQDGLRDLPITVPPSQTNFLFIDMQKDSEFIFKELQKAGVIVRPVGPKAIRVSTGLREDNERFLDNFKRLILAD